MNLGHQSVDLEPRDAPSQVIAGAEGERTAPRRRAGLRTPEQPLDLVAAKEPASSHAHPRKLAGASQPLDSLHVHVQQSRGLVRAERMHEAPCRGTLECYSAASIG